MPKPKANNSTEPLTEARMEELLSGQTNVILEAVDQRLKEGFATQEVRILSAVEKRLDKLEERFMKKLNDLTTTLDKFLKRLTDLEDELAFVKKDITRIKTTIREKLGVSLD